MESRAGPMGKCKEKQMGSSAPTSGNWRCGESYEFDKNKPSSQYDSSLPLHSLLTQRIFSLLCSSSKKTKKEISSRWFAFSRELISVIPRLQSSYSINILTFFSFFFSNYFIEIREEKKYICCLLQCIMWAFQHCFLSLNFLNRIFCDFLFILPFDLTLGGGVLSPANCSLIWDSSEVKTVNHLPSLPLLFFCLSGLWIFLFSFRQLQVFKEKPSLF